MNELIKIQKVESNLGPTATFPGLSAAQAKWVADKTKGLEGVEKIKATSDWYKKALNRNIQNKQKKESEAAINEMSYRGLTSNDTKQGDTLMSGSNAELLVSMAKEKFGLNQKTPSKQVLKGLIKLNQKQGISNALMNKYIQNGDEEYLYKMGFIEKQAPKVQEEENNWFKGSFGANVLGGVVDSLQGTTRFLEKVGTDIAGSIANKIKGEGYIDIEKEKQHIDEYNDNLFDIGQNRDSWTYKGTNLATDVAQLLLGNGGLKTTEKVIETAPKVQKRLNVFKAGTDVVKELPKVGKALVNVAKGAAIGAEGATDMVIYNAINGDETTAKEAATGGIINLALHGMGSMLPSKQAIADYAKKLEVSGMFNSTTLQAVNNQLKRTLGDSFEGVKAAGNWMLQRGLKGDKQEIINNLSKRLGVLSEAKSELLNKSSTIIDSKYAPKAVYELYNDFKGKIGQEKVAEQLSQWLGKTKWHPTELDQLRSIIADSEKMFNNKSELTQTISGKGWDEVYKSIRGEIEDAISKEGLGNIKMLNNEIQVSKTIMDGINGKLAVEESGKAFAETTSQVYSMVGKQVNSNLTNFANFLGNIAGMEKSSLEEVLRRNGNFDDEFINYIIKKSPSAKERFMKAWADLIGGTRVDLIEPGVRNTTIKEGESGLSSSVGSMLKDTKLSEDSLLKKGLKKAVKQETIGNTSKPFNKGKKRN